ncbi:GAF domain-containing sensor histidine kinase [Fodinicola acaciae]|uniref:GAF domain-containing sensor histidine kinase n=1 Tax=Fodinicola acaciae TaxID=2681555 RepID=UPI0013D0077F|nr:GAF domain-containing protein [Fodinicola acaciae]
MNVPPLVDAITEIAGETRLPDLLRRVVSTAPAMVPASYAALEVLGPDGDVADVIRVDDVRTRSLPASLFGVPVPGRDGVFGTLYLDREPDEVTPAEAEILAAYAKAAGAAIGFAQDREDLWRREQWLDASHRVTAALLTGEGAMAAMRIIAERARLVTGAPAAAISRPLPDDRSQLVFEVVDAGDIRGGPVAGITVPVETTATGYAFTHAKRVVVRDYGKHVLVDKLSPQLLKLVSQLDSAVCIPLMVGAEPMGVLTVARYVGDVPFTEHEADLAEMFANDAALAVEFARAEDDRRRLAVLEDRDRIARDLHDLVVQRLFAIGLGLEGLSRMIVRPEMAARMTGFVRDIDRTMDDLRASIYSLRESVRRPSSFRSEMLRAGLEAATALGFEPRIDFDGPVDSVVPADLRADAIAVLREALSNVARHAAASSVLVEISVDRGGHRLTMVVDDNGEGIAEDRNRSSGLSNLRDRAARHDGDFSASRVPAGGTRLVWTARILGGQA